jgi:hypothetical protein
MDVIAALFTAAVTLGTLAPSVAETPSPATQSSLAIRAAKAAPALDLMAEPQISGVRQQSLSLAALPERPGALVPLYASLAVLQGLDIYSTSSAISRGAVEANPAMQVVSGSHWGSAAMKAAATAGSIYFIERAWKNNRKGAVILATAINVATAAVVAHNTQVARSRR